MCKCRMRQFHLDIYKMCPPVNNDRRQDECLPPLLTNFKVELARSTLALVGANVKRNFPLPLLYIHEIFIQTHSSQFFVTYGPLLIVKKFLRTTFPNKVEGVVTPPKISVLYTLLYITQDVTSTIK